MVFTGKPRHWLFTILLLSSEWCEARSCLIPAVVYYFTENFEQLGNWEERFNIILTVLSRCIYDGVLQRNKTGAEVSSHVLNDHDDLTGDYIWRGSLEIYSGFDENVVFAGLSANYVTTLPHGVKTCHIKQTQHEYTLH